MAKKKTIKGPSSVDVNSYSKGMMKDLNPSLEPKDMWTHARNVKNNSVDGDVALIGNVSTSLTVRVYITLTANLIHKCWLGGAEKRRRPKVCGKEVGRLYAN